MSRAPYIVSGTLTAAGVLWAGHLAGAPDPFSTEAGLVLGLSLLIATLIAIAGLLLSRGRWARILGYVLVGGELAIGLVSDLSAWSVAAMLASGLALVGLRGPWLDGWLRKRPASEGPPREAMALMFAALALLPAVAVASPDGLSVWHGVLAGSGILLAWAYSRAQLWALWALRTGIVLIAIPAIAESPPAGAVLLGLLVATIVWLAWTKPARLAIAPLMDGMPGPRVGSVRSDPEP